MTLNNKGINNYIFLEGQEESGRSYPEDSLALIKHNLGLEIESPLDLIVNSFENPEVAFFDSYYGPRSLFHISNKIEIEGDDGSLRNGLISHFFNVDWLGKDANYGLRSVEINGDVFYAVDFIIKNDRSRGGCDTYILFTRCNDKFVNKELLEKELNAIAEVYASLIKEGYFKVEESLTKGLFYI